MKIITFMSIFIFGINLLNAMHSNPETAQMLNNESSPQPHTITKITYTQEKKAIKGQAYNLAMQLRIADENNIDHAKKLNLLGMNTKSTGLNGFANLCNNDIHDLSMAFNDTKTTDLHRFLNSIAPFSSSYQRLQITNKSYESQIEQLKSQVEELKKNNQLNQFPTSNRNTHIKKPEIIFKDKDLAENKKISLPTKKLDSVVYQAIKTNNERRQISNIKKPNSNSSFTWQNIIGTSVIVSTLAVGLYGYYWYKPHLTHSAKIA